MKKHTYTILINPKKRLGKGICYPFQYGKTMMQLGLYGEMATVTATMTLKAEKDFAAIPQNRAFSAALKKLMLLYLVNHSKVLHVRTVVVRIDEAEQQIFDGRTDGIFLYSLLEGDLLRPLPETMQNAAFHMGLLRPNKDGLDCLEASLYAYIMGRNQQYESGRLMYNWMAMNGMYQYFWERYLLIYLHAKRVSESLQITAFQLMNGQGKGYPDDDFTRGQILLSVQQIINTQWDLQPVTLESLTKGTHQELAAAIESKLFRRTIKVGKERIPFAYSKRKKRDYYTDMTAYGYLLLWMPYRMRCDLFHAGKPMKMFSFADESDIRCLRLVNGVMERYLEEHLPLWFDREYADTVLDEKAKEVAAQL